MYTPFKLAVNYLRYFIGASNGKGHGIHSPFLYEFITRVLNDRKTYPEYERVENLRKQVLRDKTLIEIEDFGAGSGYGQASGRTVASVAKRAAKPAKYGQLLFRMARHYRPGRMLELGTSLGITSAYLSLGAPGSVLMTLEGAGAVADRAENNFSALGLSAVTLVRGNFDDRLEGVLNTMHSVDLAFIDGNHRLEPTWRYFEQLLPFTGNESILVFDDIHWSREMEQAWEKIKGHPAARCSIDLYFIGIVFLRQEFKEKQHFRIRF